MERVVKINGGNTDLNGGTQVRVPGTRQKCHRPRPEKILDGYDNSNTYIVLGSLGITANFGRLDIYLHAMILEDIKVVRRIYHNNKEYGGIINPLHTVSTQILRTIIVTDQTTTSSYNSNLL